MKRVKLVVAYDGTNYCGWQVQKNGETIESVLNRAIGELTGEEIHVMGSSRTDAGVHACGNVAVFDTEARMAADKFSYALNQRLPEDIRIQDSCEVPADFHPRFQKTVKTYEYRIYQDTFPEPVRRLYTHFTYVPLDMDRMREGAAWLIGEHDFKSFCCVKTQAESTVRTIYSVDVRTEDEAYIVIRVSGNGFLYNMIRIIAGTLVKAGKGKITPQDIDLMLEAKNRGEAGQTAPPQGLTLMNIDYVDGDDREVENQH